jgi:hypothetical protein
MQQEVKQPREFGRGAPRVLDGIPASVDRPCTARCTGQPGDEAEHHTPVGAEPPTPSSQGADKSTLHYCGLAQFSKYNKNMYYTMAKILSQAPAKIMIRKIRMYHENETRKHECMHMDPRASFRAARFCYLKPYTYSPRKCGVCHD